ncbi:MAG: TauD/TfdA family dioxygenase [Alphaproteobacteria bacterium]|nr:TauD/TfdA family dioxygenase [Alphaproteobacteria bacterium]
MDVKPLPGGTGAEIKGADLASPLSDTDVAAIVAALYDRLLVCIRNQHLSPAEFAAFARRLGTPIVHVERDILVEDVPEVMTLSNADGRPERQRNGGYHWHTDLVFTDDPVSFTMLNAIAVPKSGGETGFANQYAALDAMPAGLRKQAEAASVAHCYEGRRDGSFPTVYHPLVRTHPATGRPALYGATSTCIGVEGMPDDEARDFLDEVGRYAIAPEVQYAHSYAVDDVVIWDNAATLHTGPKLDEAHGPEEARIMNRVSVRGWPKAG